MHHRASVSEVLSDLTSASILFQVLHDSKQRFLCMSQLQVLQDRTTIEALINPVDLNKEHSTLIPTSPPGSDPRPPGDTEHRRAGTKRAAGPRNPLNKDFGV